MYITINEYKAKEIMIACQRDYYTLEALEVIIDHYDSTGEEIEFDVIGICGNWNEYGNGCALSFDSLWNDYGYTLGNDYGNDIDLLIDVLQERTTVYELNNGNVLVATF